jgi:hypothetical protein
MDPAFRDYRKNDLLRLDNATRDSNAGQIGAFLARKAGSWAHSVALAAALTAP